MDSATHAHAHPNYHINPKHTSIEDTRLHYRINLSINRGAGQTEKNKLTARMQMFIYSHPPMLPFSSRVISSCIARTTTKVSLPQRRITHHKQTSHTFPPFILPYQCKRVPSQSVKTPAKFRNAHEREEENPQTPSLS
jgi:hypothetical protein